VIRLALTLALFGVLSLAVGLLVSGDDYFDWGVAGGLFALAIAGECVRFWLKRSRAKKHQSSGI
jgi:uncharacterized membrane protein YqjE